MEDKEHRQSLVFGFSIDKKDSKVFKVQLLPGDSDGNFQSSTAC